MLPSEIQKLPPDPPVRGFPGGWKLPLLIPFPGRISVPNSIVSLFAFYILSYLLLKTIGCFSGCLISSASDQKFFCGVCSAFKCSFNGFVGEKVVSPSHSSTILALHCIFLPPLLKIRYMDLSLGFLFCSIDLYFCLCASTILSWWTLSFKSTSLLSPFTFIIETL